MVLQVLQLSRKQLRQTLTRWQVRLQGVVTSSCWQLLGDLLLL
jgi:hypothetical protein